MDIFDAIAEPTRRDIIAMLSTRGRLSASEICHNFNTSPPAISQHLKVLRDANLVYVEKQGQKRMYQINVEAMYEFERWSHKMTKTWNERFDRLDKVLKLEKLKLKNKHHGKRN